jgi:hypothetical protein
MMQLLSGWPGTLALAIAEQDNHSCRNAQSNASI